MYYEGNWIDSFPTNYQWSNATSITKGITLWGAVALAKSTRSCSAWTSLTLIPASAVVIVDQGTQPRDRRSKHLRQLRGAPTDRH
jgi:hypothetical protein